MDLQTEIILANTKWNVFIWIEQMLFTGIPRQIPRYNQDRVVNIRKFYSSKVIYSRETQSWLVPHIDRNVRNTALTLCSSKRRLRRQKLEAICRYSLLSDARRKVMLPKTEIVTRDLWPGSYARVKGWHQIVRHHLRIT